jgi:NTP pyrophosphatase (non-canonical NTP hydrolase)
MNGDATPNPAVAAAVNLLMDRAHAASARVGWWTDPATGERLSLTPERVAQKLMLIVSEVAEAMEGHRKGLQDDKLPHRPMMEVELADALIRIGDLAGAMDFDLGGAVAEKMAFNATREDHRLEARRQSGGKAY